ncbi:programmed cell death protein 2 [Powellomyces hirtus]|nr:programmed cell death protein 2 [Powellomyces hirtus]
MSAVQLGFAEPLDEPLTYTIDDFPNKIGGKPFWLNPEKVLKGDDLKCGVCEKTMVLLLQFYTPEDEPIEAYHRVLYLFCCMNGTCHKTRWRDCFKAFRSQLPQINPYFNPMEGTPAIEIKARLCHLCGLDGSKQCARCKTTRYCSREHQLLDWNLGTHKAQCTGTATASSVSSAIKNVLFPEYELVSEDEPGADKPSADDDDVSGDEDEDEHADAALETKLANVQIEEPDANEKYEDTDVDVDKAFLRFQKRILREPEQVVRYSRVSYVDGHDLEPLFVSDIGKPAAEDITPCPHCNGRRTFEFQAMPQLLNFLNIDHYSADALDWGTVIVYSCLANCQPADGQPYMEEIVWRQMFSEHGMGDSAKAALEREAALKKVVAPAASAEENVPETA